MADVPDICDVIINGQRYMYANDQDNKAAFGYTNPFVQKINTDGGFPDNQQDFWLLYGQNDWVRGEGQKHVTKDSAGLFWKGKNIDISRPGEVRAAPDKLDLGVLGGTPKSTTGQSAADKVWFVTSTNLYSVNNAGTISNAGAHGLGATPSRFGTCNDNFYVYISTGSAGTVGIRRYNIGGAAFTTWSPTSADSLCFLNNTIFGYNEATAQLNRYDTVGVASAIYVWRDGSGSGIQAITTKLFPFGGKLGILRYRGGADTGTAQLWLYDGVTAPVKVAEFPSAFKVYDACSYQETVFVGGLMENATNFGKHTIMFYKDGGIGTLWEQSEGYGSAADAYPTPIVFDQGITWGAESEVTGIFDTDRIVRYDADTGAFSTIHEASGVVASLPLMASAATFFVVFPSTSSGTVGYLWPKSTYPTSFEVITSNIDFGTFLGKIPRSVTVYYLTFGGTPTVDISYSTNDSSTFNSLATGVNSGEEIKITPPTEGTTYRSFSIKVTMNKGGGGSPDLNKITRVFLKAIPVISSASGVLPTLSLRQRTYRLGLLGIDGEGHVMFRNGEYNAKDGKQQMQDIETANNKTTPITVQDTLGSYTAIIDKINAIQIRKDEWVAEITCREV